MSRSNQLPNLDKLFRDDDECDFTPQNSSNLAALFHTPENSNFSLPLGSQNMDASPTIQSKPKNSSIKPDVIVAKTVYVYKFQNGHYTLIGKLGIALTGNPSTRTYFLILYKTKKEYISILILFPEFSFTITENHYASYYDANNDNWSILFDSSKAIEEFAREICVAKYFLRQGNLGDKILFQDLTPLKKITNKSEKVIDAQENDEIEINYVTLGTISQPLNLNNIARQTMKIKISSDDNWERSLLGVQKDLKRLMILPPSKQIGLGPGYPRERDIVMEIHVSLIVRPPTNDSLYRDLPESSGKASLISRMAKMGQSMLPKLPASTTTDSDDTENDIPMKSSTTLRPEILAQNEQETETNQDSLTIQSAPAIMSNKTDPPEESLVSATAYPYYFLPAVANQHYQPFVTTATPPQPPSDPNINVFLLETRTHNAEIRMGISKIADNVQKLLDKFHELEVQNASTPVSEKSLNESLKAILSLNNAKSNELSSNNFILEENVKSLKKDLSTTKDDLAHYVNEVKTAQDDNKKIQRENSELREKIGQLEVVCNEIQSKLDKSLVNLESSVAIAELENKMKENDRERHNELKQIMNGVHQALMSEFSQNSYTTDSIKRILASTIRSITLHVLNQEKDVTDTEQISDPEVETISISREEPPPLPPIDPDIKNDWL